MSKKINGFHLKIIAIIAMTLNHIGTGFHLGQYSQADYFFTETIGKLTFPIMAYLLVEGFHYTRNRKKYALRLAAFWLISIVPFQLLFHPTQPFLVTSLVNNIFFSLLMGLLLMMVTEKIESSAIRGLLVFLFAFATMVSDWSIIGVLMIYGFYRIKDPKKKIIIPVLYTTAGLVFLYFSAYLVEPATVPLYIVLSGLGILLVIPLLLSYNGKRGYSPAWVKWGFYLFYPAHLLLLVLIRFWLS
ncbi:TraX family protein [Enterococcus alishanensis]